MAPRPSPLPSLPSGCSISKVESSSPPRGTLWTISLPPWNGAGSKAATERSPHTKQPGLHRRESRSLRPWMNPPQVLSLPVLISKGDGELPPGVAVARRKSCGRVRGTEKARAGTPGLSGPACRLVSPRLVLRYVSLIRCRYLKVGRVHIK